MDIFSVIRVALRVFLGANCAFAEKGKSSMAKHRLKMILILGKVER
jgi:hypothetical protein